MGCGCASCKSHDNIKARASIVSALLFAVIASPQLFAVMQGLLGGLVRVTGASGVPTWAGLVLHSVVFGVVVYAWMHVAKRGGCGGGQLRRYPYGSY